MAAGKTVTVRVTGGSPDYTSLSAAEAGEAADFTSSSAGSVTIRGRTYTNIALHIECDPAGGDDTTAFTFGTTAGWDIDATHRVLISCKESEWSTNSSDFRPGGGFGYKLAVNGVAYGVFQALNGVLNLNHFLIVAGLEIEQSNTGSGGRCLYWDQDSSAGPNEGTIFDACIFYNKSTTAQAIGIQNRGLRLWNCFVQSDGDDAVGRLGVGGPYNNEILNCLLVNSPGAGVADLAVEAYIDLSNNVAYNNTGSDYEVSSGWRTSVGNWSEDSTAPGTGGGTTITAADFENAGTDWTPASGSDIEQGGEDLVTDGLMTDRVDAVGNTRPTGDTWAAGPLERVVSGASGIEVIGQYYRNFLAGG